MVIVTWNYRKILAWQRYSLKSEIYLSISLSHWAAGASSKELSPEYDFNDQVTILRIYRIIRKIPALRMMTTTIVWTGVGCLQ